MNEFWLFLLVFWWCMFNNKGKDFIACLKVLLLRVIFERKKKGQKRVKFQKENIFTGFSNLHSLDLCKFTNIIPKRFIEQNISYNWNSTLIFFFYFQSECLKHLLHNLRSDKGLLCDPALALNRDGTRASPSSKASSSKTLVNCEKGAQHLSVCGGSTSTNDTYKLGK